MQHQQLIRGTGVVGIRLAVKLHDSGKTARTLGPAFVGPQVLHGIGTHRYDSAFSRFMSVRISLRRDSRRARV